MANRSSLFALELMPTCLSRRRLVTSATCELRRRESLQRSAVLAAVPPSCHQQIDCDEIVPWRAWKAKRQASQVID